MLESNQKTIKSEKFGVQQVITIMGEGKDGKNSQETIIFLISFSKWALRLLKYIYIYQKETSMFKKTPRKLKRYLTMKFSSLKIPGKIKTVII